MSTTTMNPENHQQFGHDPAEGQAEVEMPIAGARPNHMPSPETQEAGRDPFEFLSVETIGQMRDRQHELVSREQSALHPLNVAGREEARSKAYGHFDDTRREVLHDIAGLNENDPAYNTYMDYLKRFSLDSMPDHEWWAGQYDSDGNTVRESGRRQLQEIHDQRLQFYRALVPENQGPEANPSQPTRPEFLYTQDQVDEFMDIQDRRERKNALKHAVDEARDRLAKLAVERTGRMRDRVSDEYVEAQIAYNNAMIAYSKAGEAFLGEERSDLEKNASVTAYLLFEASQLRQEVNEIWGNTKVGIVCNFLARGNFAQRVAKGMMVGFGAASVGAVITAATGGSGLAGAIGGGIATGGVVMTRLAQGYAAVRGRKGGMATDLNDQEKAYIHSLVTYGHQTSGDRMSQAAAFTRETFRRDVQGERHKNRNSAIYSVGALALGVTAGSLLAPHIESAVHGVAHAISGNGHPNTVWHPGGGQNVQPQPGSGSGGNVVPPPVEVIPGHLSPEQAYTFNHIGSGWGGEHLMNSLGANPHEWYTMQNDLLKAHPSDFYRMPDGNVGIAHPGKLSDGAMQDIAQKLGIWRG